MFIDLAFILNTTDDGVDPTEKIEDDDIINIGWAIYTNQHTNDVVEYEAGVATYFKGAPGDDASSPDTQWTVYQTLTKALLVTSSRTYPSEIIPTQKGADTKVVKLGETDKEPALFWQWMQDDTQSDDTQIAIHLRRNSISATMTITPETTIRGRVGF